ncbi:hypothetical protein B0H13DRAFT_2675827 [Mycena leptocephala]|nr:hypothetical protein B0H13DRAFT_2675827 [Mycena leptocephala]
MARLKRRRLELGVQQISSPGRRERHAPTGVLLIISRYISFTYFYIPMSILRDLAPTLRRKRRAGYTHIVASSLPQWSSHSGPLVRSFCNSGFCLRLASRT